jgi:hypothetical protein
LIRLLSSFQSFSKHQEALRWNTTRSFNQRKRWAKKPLAVVVAFASGRSLVITALVLEMVIDTITTAATVAVAMS